MNLRERMLDTVGYHQANPPDAGTDGTRTCFGRGDSVEELTRLLLRRSLPQRASGNFRAADLGAEQIGASLKHCLWGTGGQEPRLRCFDAKPRTRWSTAREPNRYCFSHNPKENQPNLIISILTSFAYEPVSKLAITPR